MKRILFLATIIALVSTPGCKKSTSTATCGNGTFNCTINGVSFAAASTNESTLLKSSYGGTPVKRMDIRAKAADGKYIILTITNLQNAGSGDGVVLKDYFADVTKNYSNAAGYEGALTTYTQGSTTTLGQSSVAGGSSNYKITITSCDETAHTVAGTFNMDLDDYTGNGNSYAVSGSFSNVCYTIR